ncbi:MAG: hypothetical protein V9F46_11625 [Chitinophagaceae bacterium]
MDTKNIPPAILAHADEIRLRGFYLSITVDLDFTLVMLIHECFKSNPKEIKTFYKDKKGKGKDVADLTMFERLGVCQKGLAKYHPKAYKQHKGNFVSIDILRQVRNKFAHDKIDNHISPNDTTKLTFHKLRKNFLFEMTEYTIEHLYKELLEYRNTMQDTLRLIAKVMNYPEPTF